MYRNELNTCNICENDNSIVYQGVMVYTLLNSFFVNKPNVHLIEQSRKRTKSLVLFSSGECLFKNIFCNILFIV